MNKVNVPANLNIEEKLREVNGLAEESESKEEVTSIKKDVKEAPKVKVENKKIDARDKSVMKVDVLIDGLVYTLVTDDNCDYIKELAFYVNQKIKEIKGIGNTVMFDTRQIAILACMNIADEYFKVKKQLGRTDLVHKNSEKEIEIYKEEYEKLVKENELLKENIKKLKKII